MNDLRFTFSDTIAGYVTSFDQGTRRLVMKTSDGREFAVESDRHDVGGAGPQPGRAVRGRERPGQPDARARPVPVRLRRLLPGGRRTRVRSQAAGLPRPQRGSVPVREAGLVDQADRLARRLVSEVAVRHRRRRLPRLPHDAQPRGRQEGRPPARRPTPSRGWSTASPPPSCSPARIATWRRRAGHGVPARPHALLRPGREHRLLVPRHRGRRRPRDRSSSPRSSATTTTRSRCTSRSTRWPGRRRPTASPATRGSCSDIESTIRLFDRFYLDQRRGRLLLAPRPDHARPAEPIARAETRARRTGTRSATTPRPT